MTRTALKTTTEGSTTMRSDRLNADRTSGPSRRGARVRLCLEALDGRCLPSTTVLPDIVLSPPSDVPAEVIHTEPKQGNAPIAVLPANEFRGTLLSVPGSLVEGREVSIDWGDGQISVGEVVLAGDGTAAIRVHTVLAEAMTYFATVRFTDSANPDNPLEIPLEVLTIPADTEGGLGAESVEPADVDYQLESFGSFAGIWITLPDYSRIGGKPDSADPVDPLDGQGSTGKSPDTELEPPIAPPGGEVPLNNGSGEPPSIEPPILPPPPDATQPHQSPRHPGPTSESEFQPGEVQAAPVAPSGSLGLAPSPVTSSLGVPAVPVNVSRNPDVTWWLGPVALSQSLVPEGILTPGNGHSPVSVLDNPKPDETDSGRPLRPASQSGSAQHRYSQSLFRGTDSDEEWSVHGIDVDVPTSTPMSGPSAHDPDSILASYLAKTVPTPEFAVGTPNPTEPDSSNPGSKWRTRAAWLVVGVGVGVRVVRNWWTAAKLGEPPAVITEPRQVPELTNRVADVKPVPRA